MDEKLKRRLVGATVLVSLAIIFVPMLLEDGPVVSTTIDETNIPLRPDREFSSKILPMESETLDSMPAEDGSTPDDIDRSEDGRQQTEDEDGGEEKQPTVSDEQPVQSEDLREGISAWVVQVGSFSQQQNATKVELDLQQKGFSAFVEQTDMQGRQLYRVLVGPEVDKKRADKIMQNLKPAIEQWKLEGKLRRYP